MKFCKYCGRQIGDNEICTCPDAQAEAQRTAQQPEPQLTETPVYDETPVQQSAPQEIQYETPEQTVSQSEQQVSQPEMFQQPPVQDAQPSTPQPTEQPQPVPTENQAADFSENPAAVFNAPTQQAPINHNQPVAPPQQPYYTGQPYAQQYNQQYVPQQVQAAPSSVDFSKFTHFFKNYFVNPNEAVNEHAKAKDPATLIILSVLFVLMSGLCDLGLGINIGYKAGAFFAFGIMFAIVGLAMTFGSNILYTTLTNQKQDAVELISKSILHTPMTTALLFLGIFISLIKSPVLIAVYYVIIAITYAVSQISVLIEYTKTQGPSMLKKLYFFGVVFVFTVVMLILAYLQCKTVISSLIDSYFGSWF